MGAFGADAVHKRNNPCGCVMSTFFLLGLAGAMGALARYWLSGVVYTFMGRGLPWGTWAVNVLGSFFFGLVWAMSVERGMLSPQARIIILVGFLGAFTTFSTLMFESYGLMQDAAWFRLGLNVAGQNIVGFLAMCLGMACGRIL